MSVRDARMLVDFVAGSAPSPAMTGAYDYARPRVQGGGPRRPTSGAVRIMLGKYMEENERAASWDEVFEELIKKHAEDPEVTRFIKLVFRDGLGEIGTCDEMHISRATYYKNRLAILSQAGLLAVQKELLSP